MKKVNFNSSFQEFDGTEIKGENNQPFLIKTAVMNKLAGAQHSDVDKSFDCYNLAKRIHDSTEEIELSDKEITMIKESLLGLPILLVGQIINLLV